MVDRLRSRKSAPTTTGDEAAPLSETPDVSPLNDDPRPQPALRAEPAAAATETLAAPGAAPGAAPAEGVAALPGETAEEVWAHVQLARHLQRPHTLELATAMSESFVELHGDRYFRDDASVVAGFASIEGRRVAIVGHQKGNDTDSNIRRNFGLPHPEGIRKAMRVMETAERLGIPVVSFVDTQGAFPGATAEERGISDAIARSIALMSGLRVPIVTVITGEGGSGGALALGVGDVVIALENAIYSVISPEGCAAILWRTNEAAPKAALAMRVSAQDQLELGVVDEIVPEPGGGAHEAPIEMAERLKGVILGHLDRLAWIPTDELLERRYRRYRGFGAYTVGTETPAATLAPAEQPARISDRLRGVFESGRKVVRSAPVPAPLRPKDEPPARDEV